MTGIAVYLDTLLGVFGGREVGHDASGFLLELPQPAVYSPVNEGHLQDQKASCLFREDTVSIGSTCITGLGN